MAETQHGVLQDTRDRRLAYEARRRPAVADEVCRRLVPLLSSDEERVVVEALNLLVAVGPAAYPAVPDVRRVLLEHSSRTAQGAAICALSQLALKHPEAVVDDLAAAARRPEHQKLALWWLFHLRHGARPASPLLAELAQTAPTADVRCLAVRGLRLVTADAELAARVWTRALTDRSKKVREVARAHLEA